MGDRTRVKPADRNPWASRKHKVFLDRSRLNRWLGTEAVWHRRLAGGRKEDRFRYLTGETPVPQANVKCQDKNPAGGNKRTMTLRVYNTLSGEKELFEPVQPGKVGIYLCGPTVYKPAHIGHAVGPVIFDAIKRYLTFKGFRVTWVVNITDVEDKLIAEAKERGMTVRQLARDLEQKYIESLAALGVKSIDRLPRASEHIEEIIAIVQKLADQDVAYVVDGDVYFDVSKDADYGKLTNRNPDEQFAGTRDGLDHSAKRNPGDFTLWKAAKPEEPDDVKFDSPWGKGRPGWHIE